MAAMVREFRFPLDIELLEHPNLNEANNSVLFHYLRSLSCNSKILILVLQPLLEERVLSHKELWNGGKTKYIFEEGDVVKSHVQVQLRLDKGEVVKLSYKARGPLFE